MALTKTEAVQRVAAEIGAAVVAAESDATEIILGDETVPFLSAELSGKRTWQVRCDGVTIADDDRVNPDLRSFDVLLSPDVGHVMKMRTRWPRGTAPMTPPPSVGDEATQWIATGERFVGLPAAAPKVALSEAVRSARGGASNAKEIIAYYVLYTCEYAGIRDRPVWVVQLRGLPPFPLSHRRSRTLPEDWRNHLTSIIDARTGKFIVGGTIPQPEFD
jgi:hypothetical protein